jgi:maltokinase
VYADVRTAIAFGGPSIWSPIGRPSSPRLGVETLDLVPLPTGWLAIGRAGDELAVAPVVRDGSGARRAVPGDGAFLALAGALAAPVVGLSCRAVDRDLDVRGPERSLAAHTNELAVVGERAVVKLFARTGRGPQPGAVVPAHLAAVGFTDMPRQIGTVWWHDALVATVTTFIEDATDGWTWFVEGVAAAAAGELPWADVDTYASAIGALMARLHRALATPSDVLPTPVAWAGRDRVAAWRRAAGSTLETAAALTGGEEGQRLRAIEPAARDALAALAEIDRTPVMPIHGDLHVGQILRTPDGALLVNDFDGNPLLPIRRRSEPQAPARDVAWMLAAIDHVGRVVIRRRPDLTAAVTRWIERGRDAFLGSYREALGDRQELFDERLIGPFSVAQEAHEFLYAINVDPSWRVVPDAALPVALARLAAT